MPLKFVDNFYLFTTTHQQREKSVISHTKVKSKINLGILELKHKQTYYSFFNFIENIKHYSTIKIHASYPMLLIGRETKTSLKKYVALHD